MTHEHADIGMVRAARVGQNLAVMFSEAGKQLLLVETVEHPESKELAGTLILIRSIVETVIADAVGESCRCEVVVARDDGQCLLKRRGVVRAQAGDEVVERELLSVSGKMQRIALTRPAFG